MFSLQDMGDVWVALDARHHWVWARLADGPGEVEVLSRIELMSSQEDDLVLEPSLADFSCLLFCYGAQVDACDLSAQRTRNGLDLQAILNGGGK